MHDCRPRVRVAAYQAPLAVSELGEAARLLSEQLRRCDEAGVAVLCTPEAFLGGLADYARDPSRCALDVAAGDLHAVAAGLGGAHAAVVLGFTERGPEGRLFNSAAVMRRGELLGVYRKLYPAIHRSVYSAGDALPTFEIDGFRFGVLLCLDSNYFAPARILAARGAAALFVPTNNGMPPSRGSPKLIGLTRSTDIARALENGVSVVRADVVGSAGGLVAPGTTAVVDPDGEVLAAAAAGLPGLIVADIEADPRDRRRCWDAGTNPAVVEAYSRLDAPWRLP